jgi:hypothetical protein
VAKLWANTLWGYLALNTNKTQFRIISDRHVWEELVSNDRFIISEVYSNSNDNLQVSFKEVGEVHLGNCKTNVIIAAFVTAHARIKLFNELQKLGDRVLYFDTDSIFFISRVGQYEPPLGDYLGQFTSEIDQKLGNHIVEFVSGGPKNYAYRFDTGYTD